MAPSPEEHFLRSSAGKLKPTANRLAVEGTRKRSPAVHFIRGRNSESNQVPLDHHVYNHQLARDSFGHDKRSLESAWHWHYFDLEADQVSRRPVIFEVRE